jgi:hypothetical protein
MMRSVVVHAVFNYERGAKMKSLTGIGTFSILLAALVSPIFADEQPPTQDTPQVKKAAEKSKPPFTISKETTRLTEPLRADGRVDYVAALNKICSEGVTPENNAVVLLLQAVGPEVFESEHREQNYRMLGIKPLPDKGDYLIHYEKFQPEVKSEVDEGEEEAAKRDPTEQQKQLDRFYETIDKPWTAAKYPRYAAWMKANEKPLEKIREASLRPRYYTPMITGDAEYASMISVLLPLTQESRECARLLRAHAMFSIGEGNIEDARRDILACHRLARLVGQGACLVDALVAIAIDGIACKLDVALAQSGKLSPQEAAAFMVELKKLPPIPEMADKVDVSERYMFLDCVEMIAAKGVDSISALSGGGVAQAKDTPLKSIISRAIFSVSDWDAILRMGNAWYDRMVEAARKPTYAERTEAFNKIDAEIRKISQDVKSLNNVGSSLMAGEAMHTILSKKFGNILVSLLTPALGAVIHAEERGYVYSDMSQIALALGAYRSDHGNYPDRLADLAPKYLAEVPKDGFSGADFVYHREGNGYLLYSVGRNGKDDGGKSQQNDPPDEEGDDFVVRTPKEAM